MRVLSATILRAMEFSSSLSLFESERNTLYSS